MYSACRLDASHTIMYSKIEQFIYLSNQREYYEHLIYSTLHFSILLKNNIYTFGKITQSELGV